MYSILRPSRARIGAFLLTLSVSLALIGARWIYVNRQSLYGAAAYDGDINRMRLIEILGVDVNASACDRCPLPLVLASWGGNREAVKFLLARGANINDAGKFDQTPLMMASYFGDTEMVRLLLGRGADVKFQDNYGETALSIATVRKHFAVIRLLRAAGGFEALPTDNLNNR